MKKGLVFRELYLVRKNYVLSLIIWLIIAVIGILIPLSIKYGNLADMAIGESVDRQAELFNIYLYIPMLVLMISVQLPDVIYADYASKWALFRITTPLSEREYSNARYILKSLVLLAAVLLNLIITLVICNLYDQPFTRTIFGTQMLIALVTQLVGIITERLALINKEKNKATAKVMIRFMIIYFVACGITGYFILMLSEEQMNAFKDGLLYWFNRIVTFAAPILPLLVILSLYVGRNVFAHTMKRRDF